VIQASAVPGLSHVISLRENTLKFSVEERHKYEPTVQKVTINPFNRMEDICLWSHFALTREINVCIHSFSLPQIAYELHSTQISQHYHKTEISLWDWNLNNFWGCTWHVQWAPNFIAHSLHLQQELFVKN